MFSPSPSLQDNNGIECLVGDCTSHKKYSHIYLLHMINEVETEKATIAAGNRCYYLGGGGGGVEQWTTNI